MALRVLFVNPNCTFFSVPNLGLAYVMSAIARNHSVRLLDFTFHAHEPVLLLKRGLAGYVPDVIAVSVNNFTVFDALRITRWLKERYAQAYVIWGGVYPTLFPEDSIRHPLVDAICRGEGEWALNDFLRQWEDGTDAAVPGIWYKKKDGGSVIGPSRPFVRDLDALPSPDWDSWEIDRYLHSSQFFYGSLVHMSSRGCPMDCSFCSAPAMRRSSPGPFYRCRDPFNVVDEIEENSRKYADRGLRVVSFLDSLFGLDDAWLSRFCDEYMRRRLMDRVRWHCQARVDSLTEQKISCMKDAGCILIDVGVESGNDRIRNQVYRKNILYEDILRVVGILKRKHMAFRINIIIGCPYDTPATIGDSLRLLRTMKPTVSRVSFYQPLPGTDLYGRIPGFLRHEPKGALNPWDYPRCSVPACSTRFLVGTMWLLRIKKFFRAFGYGMFFPPGVLLQKIWRYFTKQRAVPLWHPYCYLNLIEFMEQEYIYHGSFVLTAYKGNTTHE